MRRETIRSAPESRPAVARPPKVTTTPKEASFEFAPLSRTEYVYQGIFQADETGRLGSAEDVRLWREGWTTGEPSSGNSVPPAEVGLPRRGHRPSRDL